MNNCALEIVDFRYVNGPSNSFATDVAQAKADGFIPLCGNDSLAVVIGTYILAQPWVKLAPAA